MTDPITIQQYVAGDDLGLDEYYIKLYTGTSNYITSGGVSPWRLPDGKLLLSARMIGGSSPVNINYINTYVWINSNGTFDKQRAWYESTAAANHCPSSGIRLLKYGNNYYTPAILPYQAFTTHDGTNAGPSISCSSIAGNSSYSPPINGEGAPGLVDPYKLAYSTTFNNYSERFLDYVPGVTTARTYYTVGSNRQTVAAGGWTRLPSLGKGITNVAEYDGTSQRIWGISTGNLTADGLPTGTWTQLYKGPAGVAIYPSGYPGYSSNDGGRISAIGKGLQGGTYYLSVCAVIEDPFGTPVIKNSNNAYSFGYNTETIGSSGVGVHCPNVYSGYQGLWFMSIDSATLGFQILVIDDYWPDRVHNVHYRLNGSPVPWALYPDPASDEHVIFQYQEGTHTMHLMRLHWSSILASKAFPTANITTAVPTNTPIRYTGFTAQARVNESYSGAASAAYTSSTSTEYTPSAPATFVYDDQKG